MPTRFPNAVRDRIATLQREIQTLKLGTARKKKINNFTAARAAKKTPFSRAQREVPTRKNHRTRCVPIVGGINLTTVLGSLYSTSLKVYAALGHLDQHDRLFGNFEKNQTPESAVALLKQIGVAREELDSFVRVDEDFHRHCDEQTQRYQRSAAAGDAKARGILNNPKICTEQGIWIGDIDEAVRILRGGRTLKQVRRGRNQQILNNAGLMFDTQEIGGMHLGFLYRQLWHRQFKRAVDLARAYEEKPL